MISEVIWQRYASTIFLATMFTQSIRITVLYLYGFQGIILKQNGKVGDAERMFIQVSYCFVSSLSFFLFSPDHVISCSLQSVTVQLSYTRA
jgi:hypothetical protein